MHYYTDSTRIHVSNGHERTALEALTGASRHSGARSQIARAALVGLRHVEFPTVFLTITDLANLPRRGTLFGCPSPPARNPLREPAYAAIYQVLLEIRSLP